MTLTWFFEGRLRLVPRMFCVYYKTLAHVMESSGAYNDSPPLDISHTLGTLNDGKMGLVGAYSVMMAHIWVRSPTGWAEYPRSYSSPRSKMLQ
jgi:hypothetical protein